MGKTWNDQSENEAFGPWWLECDKNDKFVLYSPGNGYICDLDDTKHEAEVFDGDIVFFDSYEEAKEAAKKISYEVRVEYY